MAALRQPTVKDIAERTPQEDGSEAAMPAAQTPDRHTENFGVPWEESYGYVQAIKHGDTIYLSGQLAHNAVDLVAPAPLDEDGKVTDYGNMGEQMQQAYRNAETLLRRFGASLADVVEEVLYVLDIDAAFQVAGPVRKAAYGREDPQVASTLVGTPRLAFPEQLIEIKLIART
jgi:enamine deaminase RidA (YjgF/YER057c/UK114 family)